MVDGGAAALIIDITIHGNGWRGLSGLEHMTKRAIAAAGARMTQPGEVSGEFPGEVPGEVCVVFADDAFQRDLNRRFRGRDAPTNVLSFQSDPPLLGDIVLAHETVFGEARAQGKLVADHISHLLVHGMLHLMGYDHQSEEDRLRMESLEIAILQELGVSDPYLIAHEQRS